MTAVKSTKKKFELIFKVLSISDGGEKKFKSPIQNSATSFYTKQLSTVENKWIYGIRKI